MKKMKKGCQIIIIFVVVMVLINVLPVLILRTYDVVFQIPEYWVISALITATVTWKVVQAINSSE